MRRKHTPYRIALILDSRGKALMDKLEGVLKFANTRPDWEIRILTPAILPQTIDDALAVAHPDGLIWMFASSWGELKRIPDGCLCALIDYPYRDGIYAAANVRVEADDRSIATTVATRFVRAGFANFAYFGHGKSSPHCIERRKTFERIVTQKSHSTFSAFFDYTIPDNTPHPVMDADLENWLRALPKPCAMMTYSDDRAKLILDACRRIGIKIPQQIAVISVDNEVLLCDNSRPTLSSVSPDFKSAGFRAAAELARKLDKGEPGPLVVGKYGPSELIERESSQDVRGSARIVSAAREIIRKKALSGLRVDELAKELGISMRILQLRFAAIANHGAKTEILDAQLAEAKRLLSSTSIRIGEIAGLCGFENPATLKRRFKERFGTTMLDYRKTRQTAS